MSEVMVKMPKTHPLRAAWDEFRKSHRYTDLEMQTKMGGEFIEGALWGIWFEAYSRATERAAMLHESVNPASDAERLAKVPGAGAMGAVIEYRDMIRKE